jgi:putative ABC transport system substrate-binding protein
MIRFLPSIAAASLHKAFLPIVFNDVHASLRVIDARAGVASQIPELARALVASNLDAIVAVSDISIEAAKAASGTIPIVMSFGTGDPVAAGFATSITRPGGNITGVVMLAPELNAKRLTLLHEAMPKARRIAALAVSEHRYETILQTIRTIAAGVSAQPH